MQDSIQIRCEVDGHFKLTSNGPTRGRLVQAEFHNLILDQGLERIGTGSAVSACQVGAGTSTPSNIQAALDSLIAGTTTTQAESHTFVDGEAPYWRYTVTKRFAEGVAQGILAEVGMGWGTSGSSLFSRARILDGGGTPTTITILSNETLDVEYTLRFYIPVTDVTGTRMINGVSTAYTLRAAVISSGYWTYPAILATGAPTGIGSTLEMYSGNATLGTVYTQPSAAEMTTAGISSATYVPNSLKSVLNASIPLNNGNMAGGIGAVRFSLIRGFGGSNANALTFQCLFNPPIAKTADYIATMQFSVSWARKT